MASLNPCDDDVSGSFSISFWSASVCCAGAVSSRPPPDASDRDFLAGACEIQLSMDRYRRGAATETLVTKA